MTHNTNSQTDQTDESSRRMFLKAGSMTIIGATLAVNGPGTVTAQDGGDGLFVEGEASEGVMYPEHFKSNGLFTITSPPIDNAPQEAEGLFENLFTDYNMRTIRYIRPNTQNIPLFIQEEADVGPYAEQLGFVVDNDFLQNGDVVFDGTPLQDLNQQQLTNVRPTIFALGPNTELFQDSDRLMSVQFSPIPEQQEQHVFNQNKQEIFGGNNPFTPTQQGTNTGSRNQTTGNQTGRNQSSFDG